MTPSQASPLTPHVDYMRPEDAWIDGWIACERHAAAEGDAHDRLVAPHVRELDRIFARIDGIEKAPRWRPRGSGGLLAVAGAVGLLKDAA